MDERSPTRFSELLNVDLEAYPELRAYVPDFSLLVDDLSRATDGALRARTLDLFPYLALKLMRNGRRGEPDLGDISELALAFRKVYAAGNGVEAFSQLLNYYARVVADPEQFEAFRAIIAEVAPEAKETVMTLAEMWQREGGIRERRRLLIAGLERKFPRMSEAKRTVIDSASADELLVYFDRLLTAASIDGVFNDK